MEQRCVKQCWGGLWFALGGVDLGIQMGCGGWWWEPEWAMMCPPSAAAHQRPGCLKAGVEFFNFFSLLVCVRSREVSQSISLGAQVVLALQCLSHLGHSCGDIVFGQEGAVLSSLWWYRCTATRRLVSEVKHQFWGRPAKPSVTSDTFRAWIAMEAKPLQGKGGNEFVSGNRSLISFLKLPRSHPVRCQVRSEEGRQFVADQRC